jgi:hypothetical protein
MSLATKPMEMSPDAGLIPAETILAVRAEEVFANTLDPASERVHEKDSIPWGILEN